LKKSGRIEITHYHPVVFRYYTPYNVYMPNRSAVFPQYQSPLSIAQSPAKKNIRNGDKDETAGKIYYEKRF